ncbi:hypothetical protein GLOIN_2v1763545 [Rhizophagus irregularis DAOM 181602=DAOM 197198]|uniref:Uncharacterized protein n=1 Tax=Rhizophagus irregularis (strain DAOM 181602 / DAOM 197198 / MUCL 43194) TaxID=747089 RepID=A0A2H5T0S9_RHIID|nr:hypothetical protein GLOIN_2v1763545 [Rhizophagus irregularis DAOM 181602=DAOM 197198]POG81306.1 hypothetical protein GLOIN_2v1763545 [Rhizophagus irregularis DAOM 181602=DAOM 197198]|eukprot:XP_025188172.1 hypothetical protein GLOIN_2v1763545 [Rhizophagus irregularis DAOM 181602=DAOM 197198]
MAGIATRYVTENEFNTEMSIEKLRYNFSEEQVFALIPKLTAGQKKGGALPNVPDTLDITQKAEPDTVNTCQILPKETIRDLAQCIIQDNLNEAEVKVIAKALVESAFNASASLSRISRLRRELSLEKNEERARGSLVWIQEAISSGQLRDPRKPRVLWFNTFLKKDEFLPETGKLLLPSSLRKLGAVFAVVSNCAKNLLEAMTIASEALRHSSDNYASPA